ncbi:MAG: Gfo/Idh/MocA family oxidoreductase [Acidobacteria bacterium]|nr:Gfo/Idh/MocA family oxidoreductase [Acidobacteriota bacterium]
MDRRAFLLTSAAALQVRGANDRINVAVIGVGGRGTGHVREYCRLPLARVAAVCDVDQAQTERAVALAEKAQGTKPKAYTDMRKLFDDKDIDAVSIATPNHWHSLSTIWACQAGKDVYVEKPASYNVFEGERMTAAASRYNRIVQVGMQSRSIPHKKRAIELLRQGAIGKVYMAKGMCFKRRPTIGHKPDGPVPAGVDWDLFLGPAPMRPFNPNRFRYNWHWFWDTGNGDIGNQGIHEMDVARWGLGRDLPTAVVSTGGKYVYDDDQETPNTQIATFDYGDATLVFEVRGLNSGGETGMTPAGPNFVGNIFFGSSGFLTVDGAGFQIFLGDRREPGESMKAERGIETGAHMTNFLEAVRSRNYKDLTGDVAVGAMSADLVHIANISYRLKRRLEFDPATRKFRGDAEANAMLTRPKYRAPYVVA